MAHIGVKNRTKEEQTLKFDGRATVFAPGETRIVEGIPHDFIESKVHVKHKTKKRVIDGEEHVEQLPHLESHKLFEIVPLAEALKHAAPEEDPRVVAARKAEGAKAAERKQLMAEIRQELEAEGWVPPEKKGEKSKKEKGGKEAA